MIYLLLNLIGFILCFKDKRAAIKERWRVPEKTFFLLGLFWGAAGIYIAMLLFRHKTKHWYFKYGMPVLVIVNIVTLYKITELIGGTMI
ncbi:MAG: DUF1294 domain-containing protein [Firmicutes bacterium]|nr:DUF1294 domain-containing protein [Bacillota bacterium]